MNEKHDLMEMHHLTRVKTIVDEKECIILTLSNDPIKESHPFTPGASLECFY